MAPGALPSYIIIRDYVLTPFFSSPSEVVKQTSYTSKADIWSLGCVTIEMLTGDHPYVNLNQMQALFKVRLAHLIACWPRSHLLSIQIGTASGGPDIPSNITPDAHKFLEQTFSMFVLVISNDVCLCTY